ncbi:hypothetical protein [Stenotrophomonas maltophilia]|uniref:hypothetical protein n=1 Tax=Stenotrophomonas maltophilia TaxID=40324 RepID=UPI0039C0638D
MKGELWAAWMSAGGAIAGVAVSVWLHYASLRDRKAADATAARNAALVVLPSFRAAEKALTWSLNQIKSGCNPNRIGNDESGREFGIGFLRRRFDSFAPTIEAIGQLGAAAAAAQSAYHHFRELSADLEEYSQQDVAPDELYSYEGEAWGATYALLQKTEFKMRAAVGDVARLLQ